MLEETLALLGAQGRSQDALAIATYARKGKALDEALALRSVSCRDAC